MKIRGLLIFTVVLMAAVVGLAVVAASGTTTVQQAGQGEPSGPPQGGPPPGPGEGGPGGIERMASQLNLTSTQREQVKALMASQHDAGAAYQDQLKQIGDEMRSLIEGDTFDEDAARALAAKEAAAMTKLRVIGARTEAAIYQLLTADQKKTLATLRSQIPPPGRGGR